MYGIGTAEMLVFGLITIVILGVPVVAVGYIVWMAIKRRK